MPSSLSISLRDQSQLDRWWTDCLRGRGRLPVGIDPVLQRPVRSVGRGMLEDLGPVYLKVMAFPRPKHRLRYAFRALPAQHEARMLAVARDLGLAVPEVVDVRCRRRVGLPDLSFLVTRALSVAEGSPRLDEMAGMAAELAAGGVFHPDLHPGNFVRLSDGGAAVLDFQSARHRRGGLGAGERRRMAAKLLADVEVGDPDGLVSCGLIPPEDLTTVVRRASFLHREVLVGLIEACLRESEIVSAKRRWNGTEICRHGVGSVGQWHPGGPELLRWWIGDRALEVLDGQPPALGGLFRGSCWLPARYSVYIPGPNSGACLPEQAEALLEGFERYRGIKKEISSSPRC